eukprot:1471470-Pyramimonas_sp.AAC.2
MGSESLCADDRPCCRICLDTNGDMISPCRTMRLKGDNGVLQMQRNSQALCESEEEKRKCDEGTCLTL